MILRHPQKLFPRVLRRHLHSTPPPPPPQSAITNLTPTRRLLQLHGIDAPNFLHGITTTIPTLSAPAYTAFLTAQGRILFDAFVYPTNASSAWRSISTAPDDPAFLIEVDAEVLPRLQAHIRRYKLRSKFSVRPAGPEEWSAWASWGSATPKCELGFTDSRVPGFGQRFLLPGSQRPEVDAEEASPEQYRVRRILWGVAEGQGEMLEGSALPQESNLDMCNGVDFRKGCYVGQELTIRTKHTGVVRKRILPVQIYSKEQGVPEELKYEAREMELPPAGTNIKPVAKRGRSTGKWLSGVGNIGFALCRLEAMTTVRLGGQQEGAGAGFQEGDEFAVEWEREGRNKDVRIKAFVPAWMQLPTR